MPSIKSDYVFIKQRLEQSIDDVITAFQYEDTESLYQAYARFGLLLGIQPIYQDFVQPSKINCPRKSAPKRVRFEDDFRQMDEFRFGDKRSLAFFGMHEDEELNADDRAARKAWDIEKENIGYSGLKTKFDQPQIIDNQAAYPTSLNLEKDPVRSIKKNSKSHLCELTEWKQPKLVTIDDSRKLGGGVIRRKDATNIKRHAPYKINRSPRHHRTSNIECTQLIVTGLSPKVDAAEIYELFHVFKSFECCSLKYDRFGVSTCTATVAFSEKREAMKALRHFTNPRNRYLAMNVHLAGSA